MVFVSINIVHRKVLRPLLFVVVVLVCFTSSLCAQPEATHWKFGQGAGLDFSSGVPVPTRSALLHLEGSASYADSNSNLLFYTDGFQAWQRDDVRMPGFQYEMPDSMSTFHSTTQQALIVPYDVNPSRFIVFNPGNSSSYMPENTIDNFEWFAEARYHASWLHVDMSSNAGLGRISSRAIDTNGGIVLSEKLTGTLDCDGEGYWVVMRERNGPRFISYKVENGIVEYPPVISNAGTFSGSDTTNLGTMKISPDGKWLAMARGWSEPGEVQLFEFNTTDGKVRRGFTLNPVTANDVYEYYGVAFSDDSKMLYVTSGPNLLQYDLTRPTQQEIAQSGFHVKTEFSIPFGNLGALQLGPDKKLYVPLVQSEFVGVIHFPRKRFDACGFEVLGVELLPGTRAYYGLPNFMDHIFAPDSVTNECLSPQAAFLFDDVCEGECIEYEEVSVNAPETWEWFFEGGTPSSWQGQEPPPICYGTPGEYTTTLKVTARGEEDYFNQTITVHPKPGELFEQDSLLICESPVELIATGADTYTFATGLPVSDSSVHVFGDEGWVYVTGETNEGCTAVDSIFVSKHSLDASISNDVEICLGDTTTLLVTGGDAHLWSPATNISAIAVPNPKVWPTSTTTYTCTVIGELGCTTTLSVTVVVQPVPLPVVVLSHTTACVGQEFSVELENDAEFVSIQWQRNNQTVSTSKRYESVVTTDDSMTLTVEHENGCAVTVPVNIEVRDSVELSVSEDITLCAGETVTISVDANVPDIEWIGPNAPPLGSTTLTISPQATVVYYIVADNGACARVDSVTVVVDDNLVVDAGPDRTICRGDTSILTVTAGDVYSWSPAEGLSRSDIRTPMASPSVTTTYSVTVARGSCVGTTSVTITVEDPPEILVSTLATLCPNEEFMLRAEGADSYVWIHGTDTIGRESELQYSLESNDELTLIATAGVCQIVESVPVAVVPTTDIVFVVPDIALAIGASTIATIEVVGLDPWLPLRDVGSVVLELEFDAKTIQLLDTLLVHSVNVVGEVGYARIELPIETLGIASLDLFVKRLMATKESGALSIVSVDFLYEHCETVYIDPAWRSGSVRLTEQCLVYDVTTIDDLSAQIHLTPQGCYYNVRGGAGTTEIQIINSIGLVVAETALYGDDDIIEGRLSALLAAGAYVVRIVRGRQQALHRILLVP